MASVDKRVLKSFQAKKYREGGGFVVRRPIGAPRRRRRSRASCRGGARAPRRCRDVAPVTAPQAGPS